MTIFFSVGEPSGDQHAAFLIRELRRRRSDLQFCGYGGPRMRQAGCRLHYPLTELAVMGFLRVIPLLWRFIRLAWQAGRFFRESRPDAVVLVDFPGFNWWIARKAKRAGIPVFYYLPPQLWAWAPWRVRRMRKFVDHVLCALPFEQDWYADRGIDAEYVGHPFFDEVETHALDRQFCREQTSRGDRIVGLLPGSRNHEVSANWPLMVEIVQRLRERHPDVRFLAACYDEDHLSECERHLQSHGERLPVELCVGKTPEVIEVADCCLMVSGSVSLEMLARRTPAVVLYRCGWPMYLLGQLLINCEYISLPNLIAGRIVLPEYPSVGNPQSEIDAMTGILDGWLRDPQSLKRATGELTQLARRIARAGGTGRAAEVILERLAPDAPLPKAA